MTAVTISQYAMKRTRLFQTMLLTRVGKGHPKVPSARPSVPALSMGSLVRTYRPACPSTRQLRNELSPLNAVGMGYEWTTCSREPEAVVFDGKKPRVINVHIAVKPQINCAQPASGDG